MKSFDLIVHFERGYIADPYWPERCKLIDIQKESGMNRARSSANRRKALEEHLQQKGMTLADYEELVRLAERPFHMEDDKIIVPELHVMGFLVATTDEIRAASKPCKPEQVRSRIQITPWRTEKAEADGVWERPVTVNSGPGAKLSNQRAIRSNHYIQDFEATGVMSIDPTYVEPKTLRAAVEWGGQFVGVGASRKMGWGRFKIVKWSARS